MNVRNISQLSPNYFEINREERNLAAIFFAALCQTGNIQRFLDNLGFDIQPGPEFGIYFEYAYLRDLWNKIENESLKKEIIHCKLDIENIEEILEMPTIEINRRFGVVGSPSKKSLQYPGRWSIGKFNKNFPDKDDFLKICKFKWAFNIKPDIVVHLDKNTAICIEAKFISKEGSYPTSGSDKAIFKTRGLSNFRQLEIQKFLMEDLLGIETEFIFLGLKRETSTSHKAMSWIEAFKILELDEMPNFTLEMISRISDYSSNKG